MAKLLGNTPAVARRSYVDLRVVDRYLSGWTIAGALERIDRLDPADDRVRARIERAVLDLLAENTDSAALERDPADGTTTDLLTAAKPHVWRRSVRLRTQLHPPQPGVIERIGLQLGGPT